MTDTLNVEVELEGGLRGYTLPLAPTIEEAAEAVRESWRFLQVAPRRITAPLLAAAYAAPLSEIVVPDFALWLWGGTGSFKSTLAGLLLSHFGDFSELDLPLSFESTSNALERSLFLAKDVLAVVDDWRPGVTRGDSDDMDRKAQRLLRAVGNRQGRNRMAADTTLRDSYPPRGAVMVTAEALPEGPAFQSATQRAICVNVSRQDVDARVLSELQENKGALSVAMAGYVAYLASCYSDLADELPGHHIALREKLRPELAGAHPRLPSNAAVLVLGLARLRDYTTSVGAMEGMEAEERFKEAARGVLEAAKAHAEATEGGDPASRFLDLLGTLLQAGHIHFEGRETEVPPGAWQLNWTVRNGESEITWTDPKGAFVGWADEDYLYVQQDAAYAAVASFAHRGGLPFGIKPNALWNALAKSHVSLTDEGRNTTTARIRGKSRRVVQMRRALVLDADVDGA